VPRAPASPRRPGTPAAGASGVTSFRRAVDVDLTPRNTLHRRGDCFLPANTSYSGLSPLQQPAAAPDVGSRDLFRRRHRSPCAQLERICSRPAHRRDESREHHQRRGAAGGRRAAAGTGWQQNWFSAVDTSGNPPLGLAPRGTGPGWPPPACNTLSVTGDVPAADRCRARCSIRRFRFEDDEGRLTRSNPASSA